MKHFLPRRTSFNAAIAASWPRNRNQAKRAPVELYEPHAVQRTMRVRALFSSTRIRTTPQFPHIYSLVGLAASSTGGALATPETESGSGTSVSLLRGRAGIVSFPITRAASTLPKKKPRALAERAGRLSTGRKKPSERKYDYVLR